jgi:hypothetical protein
MPLFTVTMKANRSAKEQDCLSRTIHAASVAAGYPEDDLFQRFLSLDLKQRPVRPNMRESLRSFYRCTSYG